MLIQDLIYQKFHVLYNRFYVCELLHNLGFSRQKACFVSDHLDEEARRRWMKEKWPEILAQAKKMKAPIFFGDEASFALWGSLSYTWALIGHQPMVKTTGSRKGYKVFGVIEFFSGRLLYQGLEDRFNSDSYQTFLLYLLAQVPGPIILIQDGAKYHTSQPTHEFFQQHQDRLIVHQLPSYSPDYNPIEERPTEYPRKTYQPQSNPDNPSLPSYGGTDGRTISNLPTEGQTTRMGYLPPGW